MNLHFLDFRLRIFGDLSGSIPVEESKTCRFGTNRTTSQCCHAPLLIEYLFPAKLTLYFLGKLLQWLKNFSNLFQLKFLKSDSEI